MAKMFGLFGSMTGKLADTVMSVRNGVQIARKYQPVVYNPSTAAQVAQRAKMKLMSQLSAVVSPYVAIPREGAVSSRNLFVKKNFRLTTYSNDQADITLANIQLTNSNVGLPPLYVTRDASSGDLIMDFNAPLTGVNRVIYVILPKGNDGKLRQGTSIVVTSPGAGNVWPASLAGYPEECVVLAYAVRDNTENARATFGNMQAVTAETIAKLIVNRTLTESDVTLTETKGLQIAAVASRDDDPDQKSTAKKK